MIFPDTLLGLQQNTKTTTEQKQFALAFEVIPGTFLVTKQAVNDEQKSKICASIGRILAQQSTGDKSPKPANHGKPWMEVDDLKVTGMLRAGISLIGIAEFLGRTPGAIHSRGQQLGLIELEQVAWP